GDGRNNAIKITATEDVFSLPQESMLGVANPDDGWQPPDLNAYPVQNRVVEEARFYELVQDQGQVNVEDQLAFNPDLGIVSAACSQPTPASINASIYTDSGAGYEDNGVVEFAPFALL